MDALRIGKLRRSLKTCAGYVNDHDYICKCRPADVRAALKAIDELQAENERLRRMMAALINAPFGTDEWDAAMNAIGEEVAAAEAAGGNDG